jgi:hypothetical protein
MLAVRNYQVPIWNSDVEAFRYQRENSQDNNDRRLDIRSLKLNLP